MPRVVPKMVLDLIDSAIDGARRQQEQIESGGNVQLFGLRACEFFSARATRRVWRMRRGWRDRERAARPGS